MSHRVLIIEDDRAIGRILQRHLDLEGFETCLARSGGEAFEAAVSASFDFVLCDFQLPDMTGEEICRHLRMLHHFADIPMALCTAKAHEVDWGRLMADLKLVQIFRKPFSLREIATEIHVAVCELLTSTTP